MLYMKVHASSSSLWGPKIKLLIIMAPFVSSLSVQGLGDVNQCVRVCVCVCVLIQLQACAVLTDEDDLF